jgi:hypothetical protein
MYIMLFNNVVELMLLFWEEKLLLYSNALWVVKWNQSPNKEQFMLFLKW